MIDPCSRENKVDWPKKKGRKNILTPPQNTSIKPSFYYIRTYVHTTIPASLLNTNLFFLLGKEGMINMMKLQLYHIFFYVVIRSFCVKKF